MYEVQSLRILAIDDDRSTLRILDAIARNRGCQIRVCGDSTKAVEIAKKFHPHLIFLDIAMPWLDGFDVAKALQEIRPNGFVLAALTACAESKYRDSCEELGFDHFVTKPVSLDQLELLIAEASERFLVPVTV